MLYRVCKNCSFNLPISHFSKRGNKYRRHSCKKCVIKIWGESNRKSKLKISYGLSYEAYEQMYRQQNGVCAICKQTNLNGKRLSVDHDHDTGKIRGLLCSHCNHGLGYFKDSIESLLMAIEYLKRQNYVQS